MRLNYYLLTFSGNSVIRIDSSLENLIVISKTQEHFNISDHKVPPKLSHTVRLRAVHLQHLLWIPALL